MAWHDTNNDIQHDHLKRKVSVYVIASWLCIWLGVWLVVSFFWNDSFNSQIRDGSPEDRNYFVIWVAIIGLLPAWVIGTAKANRDIGKQTSHKVTNNEKANVQKNIAHLTEHLEPVRKDGFSGLVLGASTGFLAARGHYGGIDHGKSVFLKPADVCKNIWIAGGIGGGKTTRFINPILHQVLAQDCSALVFDVKGDFRRELDYISSRVGRTYKMVGDGGLTLNLFRGCTPEVASSYLKSCFIASGSSSGDGAFWVETATNYCRNLLTLIKLAKGDYSIAGLADLVFSEAKRIEAMIAVDQRQKNNLLDEREIRVWNATSGYMLETVAKWEDKFRGNVQGTCESVLNPFVSPDLVDAFSIESARGEADLYDLLNKSEIFLVNLPRHKFGAQGARFAYMLIKLRFFTMMSERRARADVNQDRYCAFLCDEYQTIVDSVSDVDFWDKSRSSKCFGIVSMQGFSSLVQAVGNQKTADSIMQNWRQRAIFRTEDALTIELVQKLLGQVDVHITGESANSSSSESVSSTTSLTSSSQSHSISQSSSYGESKNIQRQHLFEANDFRKLDAKFAMFIGNIGDKAQDDVIEVQPLYVPEV